MLIASNKNGRKSLVPERGGDNAFEAPLLMMVNTTKSSQHLVVLVGQFWSMLVLDRQ